MSNLEKKLQGINDFIKYNRNDFFFYELVGIILLFPIAIVILIWLMLLLIPSIALTQIILVLTPFFGCIPISFVVQKFFPINERTRLESMFRWAFIIIGLIFVVVLMFQLLNVISLIVSLSLQLGLIGACAGTYVSLSLKGLLLLYEEWKKIISSS